MDTYTVMAFLKHMYTIRDLVLTFSCTYLPTLPAVVERVDAHLNQSGSSTNHMITLNVCRYLRPLVGWERCEGWQEIVSREFNVDVAINLHDATGEA